MVLTKVDLGASGNGGIVWRYQANWKLVSSQRFHRCNDTNELIWPFQKVWTRVLYCGLFGDNEQIKEEWLTQKAYLYRLLTQSNNE